MSTQKPLPFHGLKILIVEDEYVIAADLTRSLVALGATILGPAATLAAAEKLVLSSVRPQMAVLDINVRGAPIYPLADKLIALGVPMVFVTGYSADAIPAEYQHVPRCEKPVTPQIVEAAISSCLPQE